MTEVPEERVHDLERGAEEMEEGLGKLQGSIDTAHERADEQRERAQPEEVAGDWEDESSGAQQGDDAEDAEGRGRGDGEESVGRDTAVADAPVHEAEQVEPET